MGISTGLVGLAAAIGVGGVATTQAPALTGSAITSASATPAALPPTPAAGTASAAPVCDAGDWRGPAGINVDGRPDNLDAGDRGAVYLWHSPDGWRLRTTDVTNVAHHYTGTIALSSGARFTFFAPVRLEHGDRVWVDGNNVLHYDFTTYRGIDGLNFAVSTCDGGREHETMLFTMDINGHEDDPGRIDLGDRKQHPPFATFTVTRTA